MGLGVEALRENATTGGTSFAVAPPVLHLDAVMEQYVTADYVGAWEPSEGTNTVAPGLPVSVRALHPVSGELLAMDTLTASRSSRP